jgi:hypothetical protein
MAMTFCFANLDFWRPGVSLSTFEVVEDIQDGYQGPVENGKVNPAAM